MKISHAFALIGALAGLSACASDTSGMVTRGAYAHSPLLTATEAPSAPVPLNPSYRVTKVNVDVPATLKVDESNGYKPKADVVWREDPMGDRLAQVDTIVTDALTRGVAGLNGERAVIMDVTVLRFHALTQRTRYSIGGTHHIIFGVTLRDAATGAVVEPTRVLETEFEAYGGDKALAAEARGETQKVRITDHLASLIQTEMTRPRTWLQQG